LSERPSTTAIYALSAEGARSARRLGEGLPHAELFLPRRLAGPGDEVFDRFADALRANFDRFRGHLIFAAAGLVVRSLVGLLRNKAEDPAVVVLDPRGRFAVSLLSGHLGGANELARDAARILGGEAIITTATDSAGLPSLEEIAAEAGCLVENLGALAGLSGRLLDGETIPVWDPGGLLRPALRAWKERFRFLETLPSPEEHPGPLAWADRRVGPTADSWLVIRPPVLVLGVGCNRGTEEAEIESLVDEVLCNNGLAPGSVACLASVNAKADEPGLLRFARNRGLRTVFYEPHQLKSVEAPSPSLLVERHVGTKSVCEAAAILAAGNGELIVKKQKSKNVTVAVALKRATEEVSAS
jgi:cobalt-precorrin 5A hydrolase